MAFTERFDHVAVGVHDVESAATSSEMPWVASWWEVWTSRRRASDLSSTATRTG